MEELSCQTPGRLIHNGRSQEPKLLIPVSIWATKAPIFLASLTIFVTSSGVDLLGPLQVFLVLLVPPGSSWDRLVHLAFFYYRTVSKAQSADLLKKVEQSAERWPSRKGSKALCAGL